MSAKECRICGDVIAERRMELHPLTVLCGRLVCKKEHRRRLTYRNQIKTRARKKAKKEAEKAALAAAGGEA